MTRRILWCAAALALVCPALASAQRGGRGGAPACPPIDITGYWVSMIVDEWRFRVTPQKGDIPYLPLNARAREMANAWDPDKDAADGNACKAYGGFYLGSVGGPAARLALDCIRKVEVLEYPELGMEAVWRIEVENFPAFIVIDDKGNDFYDGLE